MSLSSDGEIEAMKSPKNEKDDSLSNNLDISSNSNSSLISNKSNNKEKTDKTISHANIIDVTEEDELIRQSFLELSQQKIEISSMQLSRIDQLKDTLSKDINIISTLEATKNKNQEEIDLLLKENKQIQSKFDELQKILLNQDHEESALRQQIEITKKEIESTKIQSSVLRNRSETLLRNAKQAENQSQMMNEKLSTLSHSIQLLAEHNHQLVQAKNGYSDYVTTLKEKQSTKDKIESELIELDFQLKDHENECSRYVQRTVNIDEKVSLEQKKQKRYTENINDLNQQLREKIEEEKEYFGLQQSLSHKKRTLESLKHHTKRSVQKLTRMKKRESNRVRKLHAVKKRLIHSQDQLESTKLSLYEMNMKIKDEVENLATEYTRRLNISMEKQQNKKKLLQEKYGKTQEKFDQMTDVMKTLEEEVKNTEDLMMKFTDLHGQLKLQYSQLKHAINQFEPVLYQKAKMMNTLKNHIKRVEENNQDISDLLVNNHSMNSRVRNLDSRWSSYNSTKVRIPKTTRRFGIY